MWPAARNISLEAMHCGKVMASSLASYLSKLLVHNSDLFMCCFLLYPVPLTKKSESCKFLSEMAPVVFIQTTWANKYAVWYKIVLTLGVITTFGCEPHFCCGNKPLFHSQHLNETWLGPTILPHQVKMQYLHFRFNANYFLLPWKVPEKLAADQCSSITKGCIYCIKHMYI